ncbi:MAG: YciI family protein [Chitinophagaceae bacterium]
MKEFLFIYRTDQKKFAQRSPEEMQSATKKWMDWVGSIAAQDKLSSRGNRLESTGKVLKPGNVITDGPYMELKESVGGYSIVKADTLDEATELAKGCPALEFGGMVEVREISVL